MTQDNSDFPVWKLVIQFLRNFPVWKLATLFQVPSDFLVRGLMTQLHWFIPRFPRIFHFLKVPRHPRGTQLSRHPRLVHSPRVHPVSLQSRSPRRSSPRGLCCPGSSLPVSLFQSSQSYPVLQASPPLNPRHSLAPTLSFDPTVPVCPPCHSRKGP